NTKSENNNTKFKSKNNNTKSKFKNNNSKSKDKKKDSKSKNKNKNSKFKNKNKDIEFNNNYNIKSKKNNNIKVIYFKLVKPKIEVLILRSLLPPITLIVKLKK
ncbi:hypothetical protein H113_09074, partial [Trichophyton rubrum MR1459]